MITLEQMGTILDALTEELPSEFFEELNGGVLLMPQTEYSPESRNHDLLVLGRYYNSSSMGRHIEIYYGSFRELYGNLSEGALTVALRKTLRHEFRHHVEWLAGSRDLEMEDERYLADYLRRRDVNPG